MSTGAITISDLSVDELDKLEPLWTALQDHNAAISPVLGHALARGRQTSWQRRRAAYERWLADPDAFIFVAERDRELVGYAVVTVGEGYASWSTGERLAELQTMSVTPEERGTHVGSALMDAVEQRLLERDVGDLAITAPVTNVDAQRFYERRGYHPAFVVLFGSTEDHQAGD
jgi:GNAT superfamily N-acetyltransferase